MPFDKETASEHGRKGGGKRWKGKSPDTNRNRQFRLNLSAEEFEYLSNKADELGLSKTELIVRAVKDYKA